MVAPPSLLLVFSSSTLSLSIFIIMIIIVVIVCGILKDEIICAVSFGVQFLSVTSPAGEQLHILHLHTYILNAILFF